MLQFIEQLFAFLNNITFSFSHAGKLRTFSGLGGDNLSVINLTRDCTGFCSLVPTYSSTVFNRERTDNLSLSVAVSHAKSALQVSPLT